MRKKFEEALGKENVSENEPMSRHTTFRVGGTADWFLTPETENELRAVLKILAEAGMTYFVMGNGSNLLVGDRGIRGAVICPYKKMSEVRVSETEIYAEGGARLAVVAAAAADAALCGMEFASGIPGSVGGAIYMNAGAYGAEMSGIVKSVRYMDESGEICEYSADECGFGYRKSVFCKKHGVILGCTLDLARSDEAAIRAYMRELNEKRVSKQPLDKPSAGSTFKRPEGYFAGALIEQSGLKGVTIGGAQVSEKHAGFVVNIGGATAKDILDLIEYVQKAVFKNTGVMLEPEVKTVGEF